MQAASFKISWREADGIGTAPIDCASELEAILSVDDAELDYSRVKLAIDRLIEPATDMEAANATLAAMAAEVRLMAGPSATPDRRMAALRALIYEAGPWNDGRPFGYDHDDPLGQRIDNKLLARYLATRRGNCVSMPALFAVLAEMLGLDAALAMAPLHVFVRYRSESGQVVNLETTSGGHPARDDWFRLKFPMSERAIASGLYMRSLTKREGVALLATTLLEHLIEQRCHVEALAVSEIILRHAPRDAYTMVKQGTVCGELIEAEFAQKYPTPAQIPMRLRPRYLALVRRNQQMFQAAEALGWEPVS